MSHPNRWHFAACFSSECGHDGFHAHLYRPDGVVADRNRPYRLASEARARMAIFAEDCMLEPIAKSDAIKGLEEDLANTEIFLNDEYERARLE